MSPVSPVFLTEVTLKIGLKTQLKWENSNLFYVGYKRLCLVNGKGIIEGSIRIEKYLEKKNGGKTNKWDLKKCIIASKRLHHKQNLHLHIFYLMILYAKYMLTIHFQNI